MTIKPLKSFLQDALQHWKMDIDSDQIAYWRLDKKDSPTNTLDTEVLNELEILIKLSQKNRDLRGIIICSGKSNGFIAGADIHQFSQFKTAQQAFEAIRQGQAIFDQLENLSIPTVAMISGFCMGGGTELALSCKFRVVEDHPKTKIACPEVKLGIQPGWGATIRLPLLIGALKAMNMLLTGQPVTASQAYKIGLADSVQPLRHLERACKALILNNPDKHQPSFLEKLPNYSFFRPLIAKLLRKKISKHVQKAHYPAPYLMIDQWEKDGCISPDAMKNEAQSLANLIVSETAQNLIRVFFLQERLKKFQSHAAILSGSGSIQHIHIIGAGVMGGDIAAWCALQGLKVTLQDREPVFIASAVKRAHVLFKNILKQPRFIQQAFDQLIPDLDGQGISQADMIIEAIIENTQAKQDLFKQLEPKAKSSCILATNTSGILLSEISSVMQNPTRLIGIHFFNPVAKMPLIEIVHDPEKTDPELIHQARQFVRQINKLPLPVKSAPGFLVNRILMPYMIEAMRLFTEGVAPETIDQAAETFGMPMGPLKLADRVGLDVCLSVGKYLLDNQHHTHPVLNLLENKIAQQQLGCKTGQGFYIYKNNHIQKNKNINMNPDISEISDRLIFIMLNEAYARLQENIVADKDLLDAGMIFGAGFPPFLGGLMHYAEKLGKQQIIQKLKTLENKYGERFLFSEHKN